MSNGKNRYYFLCEDKRTEEQKQICVESTNIDIAKDDISKLIYYNVIKTFLKKPEGIIYYLNQEEQNIIDKYSKK